MLIKKVMKPAVCVPPTATKKQLLKAAKKHPTADIFIVAGKNNKFLGDIHENDLFYMLVPNKLYEDIGVQLAFDLEKKFWAKTARELMRKHDVICFENDTTMDVALKFVRVEVNEMPVLNKKRQVVGVIDQGRLLRHMKIL
ncbi:CBS domain-containing protein [Candidatus Woesearchaeota archaeon]|nr:CBS domain-containing protein [Candidatus Woesearchaeota archaeon]MBW3005908.1 CBS domain-containing protein [Candidatus Woesearchaeota archaeon]